MTNIDFGNFSYERQPAFDTVYTTRDGEHLPYALYRNADDRDTCLIFYHGSSARHEYLRVFGQALAKALPIAVCTPTQRGHGDQPIRRGDIDYIEQLEDDSIDLIRHLQKRGYTRFLVGGHSSGGGFATRLLGSPRLADVGIVFSGGILCAPMLGPMAPSSTPESGGWATPRLSVMYPAIFLNLLGIHSMDALPALRFPAIPKPLLSDSTPVYTYRMFRGMHPRDLSGHKDLLRIQAPSLLVAGSDDEVFVASKYKQATAGMKDITVTIVPTVRHIAMMSEQAVQTVIVDWLSGLD
jgi:non-heme chloroperoxidase